MKIDLNSYKNIIFDLGGVLLNIDYNLTVKAFEQLGIPSFQKLFSQAYQEDLFDIYEKGQISSQEFRDTLNQILKKQVSNTELDAAWNAMLLNFPPARLEILKKVNQTHRTFLLSNTNEIHIGWFNNALLQQFGIPDLADYFEQVYLSYKIHLRKPDSAIFDYLLKTKELNPFETLFIDDSIQHIESAKKLGINTYWLDVRKESLTDIFS